VTVSSRASRGHGEDPDALPRERTAAESRAYDEARFGLYVHVPFCARRCSYCDFSTGAISSAAQERYLLGVALEASRRAPAVAGRSFSSVFFGGGTPSVLSARQFHRLWGVIVRHFAIDANAEITLEANPESVRAPLLDAWRAAGVNRLSMGAQSFHEDELERLGRIHDAQRPGEAAALARSAGFERISFDLMFGFPGHTLDRWRETIDRAIAIAPEHLSAYCFIPEAGTPLGDAVARGTCTLPDADEQADAYALLVESLRSAGLECYETSNFCRAQAECRHNLVYWLRRPYLALGPSAHGFLDGVRYGNRFALATWAEALESGLSCSEDERENDESLGREVMMLGLRLARGIHPSDHSEHARRVVWERYGRAFTAAFAAGRLERARESIRIPERLRFVADDVIAWIEARAEFDSRSPTFITSGTCRNLHSLVA
jgi:oxygen-independent coproporphyrinogen III oxidase